jgi:hypothetical protein
VRSLHSLHTARLVAIACRLAPLACIVAVAAVLRFDGLAFGLPNPNVRPDENVIVHKALRFGTGDLNPHYFKYPSLFFYAVFVEYVVYYGWGHLTGVFSSPAAMERAFYRDPSAFYLLARVAGALAGLATVPALYLLGRRLYSRNVGLIAALLLAGAYLHVRHSHFGVTDVPATFFAVAAMAVMARRAPREAWSRGVHAFRCSGAQLIQAGLLCGLAASTKYNLGVLIFPLMVAGLQATGDGRQAPVKTGSLRTATWLVGALGPCALRLAPALLAGLVAFAATSPFVFLDMRTALRDLAWQSAYLRAGHGGRTDLGLGVAYHALFSLRYGLGLPLAVAAVCGSCLMLRRRTWGDWLVLSFVLPYYVAIGAGHTVFVRYMVPLVPLLCLAAAVVVERLASLAARSAQRTAHSDGGASGWIRWPPDATVRLCAVRCVLCAVLLAPSLASTLATNRLLNEKDTRVLAAEWMARHVAPGSRVLMLGSHYSLPALHAAPETALAAATDEQDRRRCKMIAEAAPSPAYRLFRLADRGPELARRLAVTKPDDLDAAGIDYVAITQHPFDRTRLPGPVLSALRRGGTLCYEITPGGPDGAPGPIYDPIDAFFVPFARFHGVQRPGPTIRIVSLRRNHR